MEVCRVKAQAAFREKTVGARLIVAAALACSEAGCVSLPQSGLPAASSQVESAVASPQASSLSQETTVSSTGKDVFRSCERRLGTVAINDAQGQMPQEAMNYYQLGLPPLSKIAEHVGKTLNCFEVLDSDPGMAFVPGAAEPDFVLRVRPVEVKLSTDVGAFARRLGIGVLGLFGVASGAAMGSAALQGIGSQAAAGSATAMHGRPMQVDEVAVGIEIVCPKQRRVAGNFIGKETPATLESDKRHIFPWPDKEKANLTQELVGRAYMTAQAELVSFLSANAQVCGSSAAASQAAPAIRRQ